MKEMTRIYVLMLAAMLSLTSMTTLKACGGNTGKTTAPATEVGQQTNGDDATGGELVLGAARTDAYVPLLKGKRVALLSN